VLGAPYDPQTPGVRITTIAIPTTAIAFSVSFAVAAAPVAVAFALTTPMAPAITAPLVVKFALDQDGSNRLTLEEFTDQLER
jgi:hypothetical protein